MAALAIWFLLVEIGVEAWYRFHENRLPQAAQWIAQLPSDNPSFKPVPISGKTRQFLRYDEALNGSWQEPDGTRWQAIFLRWNPGRIAVHLAKTHTPAACLPAAGRNLVSTSDLKWLHAGGLTLPCRIYQVVDAGAAAPLHVLYCLWEDRIENQAFQAEQLTYGNRLAPVLAGRRNQGQRSIELAVWGIPDAQAAEAVFQRQLEKLLRIKNR